MVGAAIVAAIGMVGTAAVVAAAAINLAVGFAAAYFLAKSLSPTGAISASNYSQTIQSDKNAQRVIYGERQIAMVMNFAEEQAGVQEISKKSGESHERLYLAGMICNHPVNSFSNVMLDDKAISEYDGKAHISHVNGTGQIPSFILSETSQYESDMTGSSGYWLACKFTHDSTVFSGVPTPKVTVKGRMVEDVRTGQMVYTDNAALIIYDFYVHYMRVPEERLMLSGTGSFIDAANLCDEVLPTGERRYTINGMFELDQRPSDILNEMLKSCGGTLIRTNGMIGLLPAAYYGPATISITESDIVGEITMTPQEAMGDAVNVMQGSYVEPSDDWAEQDFEDVRDEALILRDGYEITEDVSYAFVTNAAQARRLCYLELNRRTIGGATEITVSPKGAYCRIGRVISLELPQLGLSGEYRVLGQTENADLTFSLTLQRDEEAIYDDSVGKPYSPPPILDTGGAVVATPIGLQYILDYNESVGNLIQGQLVWNAASSSAAKYKVVIVNADTDDIVQAGETNGYTFNVNALAQGNYEGRVRAVDSRGRTSSPASTTWSVGIPSMPDMELTEINNSNWSVEIVPNIAGGVPQGTEFEFWYLADTESYLTGQPSYDQSAINIAKLTTTASSFNHAGLTPDRYQHYWVRTINAYGKSDYIYIQTGTTKEDSLVTTVVEKLVAIEVESSNWEADAETGVSDYGYKLFSNATPKYTMPDGTVLENTYPGTDPNSIDGLLVVNKAVVRGHITATSMTFVEDENELSDWDVVQLSGGGYKQDNNQGWGITSGGSATFNGNLRVVNGTIEGGTIIGVDIYGGSQLFICDADSDPSDGVQALYYINSPEIPVACISQPRYSQSYTFKFDEYISRTFDFPIAPAADRKGSVTTDRCRWGKIGVGAISISQSTYPSNRIIHNTYVYVDIVNRDTGEAVNKGVMYWSPSAVGTSDKYWTIAGIQWRWTTTGYGGYDWTLASNGGYFGSTTDDSLNGTLRIRVVHSDGYSVYNNTLTARATIDNEVLP